MKVTNIAAVLIAIMVMGGCCGSTANHYVIAATGTNIGMEVDKSVTGNTPKAQFGYQREELAIVPTDRTDTPGLGIGAKNSPNVLMEIKNSGTLGLGNTGVYQRLAVGDIAVQQPGAAVMMNRDDMGRLPETFVTSLNWTQKAVTQIPEVE